MNIIRGKREPAEFAAADGVGEGGLSWRRALGGPAALPVLYGMIGSTKDQARDSSAWTTMDRDHLSCCC
jgi:hypothetical protein